jgi:very-short-patch-repair endonuclease
MLKHFKKSLRTSQTDAENILWYHLRNRNFQNQKFRRQHVLCGYIVDFVCLEKRLVIGAPRKRHSASSCKCCRESADPAHFVFSLGPITVM